MPLSVRRGMDAEKRINAATYLTPVLRRFAPRHSGVEIELNCEQSTALIPRVERGSWIWRSSRVTTRGAGGCCSMSPWSG